MTGALFILLSQSGRSPDLVATAEAARAAGATTVAIVNDAASPAARACAHVLPILAGPERAVAATKTVVNTLVAGAALVATMADDAALRASLNRLPACLAGALALDWSVWTDTLRAGAPAYVLARGPALAIAQEIALKLAECAGIPALAYSTAEFRHGPRAALAAITWGSVATDSRVWDGFVAWGATAKWLALDGSLQQPVFTEGATYLPSRGYPLLQPALLAQTMTWLGPLGGRLLFPCLWLSMLLTVARTLHARGARHIVSLRTVPRCIGAVAALQSRIAA
jgi:hypothetical protein